MPPYNKKDYEKKDVGYWDKAALALETQTREVVRLAAKKKVPPGLAAARINADYLARRVNGTYGVDREAYLGALAETYVHLDKDGQLSVLEKVNEDTAVGELLDAVALELGRVPIEEQPPIKWGVAAGHTQQAYESLVWYPRNTKGAGYGESIVGLEAYPYFNIRDLLARFFIVTHTAHGKIENWRKNCIGIASTNWRGIPEHMPMFDYDGKNIKTKIRQDVKMLQKDYGLGNAWVYETRRGFHVYFFCDMVSHQNFHAMLKKAQCCQGFVKAAQNQDFAVLRLSAKYTEFDIKFLYILPSKNSQLKRMLRKAHVIRSLLALGTECGTHFASMFPQWAHYQEDYEKWGPRKKKSKRIYKSKLEEISWPITEAQTGQGIANLQPANSPVFVGSGFQAVTANTSTVSTSTVTFTPSIADSATTSFGDTWAKLEENYIHKPGELDK